MSKKKVIEENLEMHQKKAENYEEEKTEIYNEEEQKRIESVLSKAKKKIKTENAKKKVLDVGCGSGNLLEKLNSRFEKVVGIDLSEKMLSVASSKFKSGENVKLVKGRVAELPFPENHFDLVSAYSVLHHLPNFSEPLSEISRVLKKGGVLYIDHEPVNREDLLVKLYIKFCDILNGTSSKGLPPYNDEDGREYCDYHIHHGENGGVPTSKIIDLCKDRGIGIITNKKYLPHSTDSKNPLRSVLEPFTDSEWLLMGRKKGSA